MLWRPGAKETLRNTSRLSAARNVENLSPVGALMALNLSVIATSSFGSAPWSPLPLTVEVIA
jgi:hypothetical protein